MSTDEREQMPTDNRTPRIISGLLGIFMGITPIVGNAILRQTTYTSAYATDDTAALHQLAFTGASIFAATGITIGPVLWAWCVKPSDPNDSIIPGWIKTYLFSPLSYVGSAIVASVTSWGILRCSGYAVSVTMPKAVIASAVGGLVVGSSLWVVTAPILGGLLLGLGAAMMSDNEEVLPRRWSAIVKRLWGIVAILGALGLYLCTRLMMPLGF